MISINTKQYRVKLEIDEVIHEIPLYPLSTESAITMSELFNKHESLTKQQDRLSQLESKIVEEENKENLTDKQKDELAKKKENYQKEFFNTTRNLKEVLQTMFENMIIDYPKHKHLLRMIPADLSMEFMRECIDVIVGKKKEQPNQERELNQLEMKSDSDDKDLV
jgi:hypothetical protein